MSHWQDIAGICIADISNVALHILQPFEKHNHSCLCVLCGQTVKTVEQKHHMLKLLPPPVSNDLELATTNTEAIRQILILGNHQEQKLDISNAVSNRGKSGGGVGGVGVGVVGVGGVGVGGGGVGGVGGVGSVSSVSMPIAMTRFLCELKHHLNYQIAYGSLSDQTTFHVLVIVCLNITAWFQQPMVWLAQSLRHHSQRVVFLVQQNDYDLLQNYLVKEQIDRAKITLLVYSNYDRDFGFLLHMSMVKKHRLRITDIQKPMDPSISLRVETQDLHTFVFF